MNDLENPKDEPEKKFGQSVGGVDPVLVRRAMKISALMTFGLIITGSIFSILSIQTNNAFLVLVSTSGAIGFICLFACFEFRLKRMTPWLTKYFGFLYSPYASGVFLLFIALLIISVAGQGTWFNYVAGGWTIFHVLMQFLSLKYNKGYAEWINADSTARRNQGMRQVINEKGKGNNNGNNPGPPKDDLDNNEFTKGGNNDNIKVGTVNMNVGGFDVPVDVNVQNPFATENDMGTADDDVWVELTDDKTGKPYYHNPANGKVSWEKPN